MYTIVLPHFFATLFSTCLEILKNSQEKKKNVVFLCRKIFVDWYIQFRVFLATNEQKTTPELQVDRKIFGFSSQKGSSCRRRLDREKKRFGTELIFALSLNRFTWLQPRMIFQDFTSWLASSSHRISGESPCRLWIQNPETFSPIPELFCPALGSKWSPFLSTVRVPC